MILLTGATGFLGMEVLARLLERNAAVVAIVRAADRQDASDRITNVLAMLYEDPTAHSGHVTAVAGDIAAPGLGLSPRDRAMLTGEVTAIVHCAASISFDLPLSQAMEINCAGTVRMLDLAEQIPQLVRFVHVSTAYVAGQTVGLFGEEDLDRGQGFRNTYEESKLAAEREIALRIDRLPLVVARPSIVVGDRYTGWTPSFNVVYWPLRAFARGLISDLPIDPRGIADIVTVDYVADALVHLLEHTEISGRLNLVAGTHAAVNEQMIALACDWLDRPIPPLRSHAGLQNSEGDSYLPYFDVATRFDDRVARRQLVGHGIESAPLAEFFGTMVGYAERTRWGKRKITREAASLTSD